jgi:hypothetical protein
MPTAGYWEPDEPRGSRPVLRERGGETPPRHSTGPLIPPEKLLRAMLLQAFYSIRSAGLELRLVRQASPQAEGGG